MVYMTHNISQDAIQAKHRPLTPNTNETGAFLTHTYAFTPHTQCPIYMNRSKVRYEDEMDNKNQKLLVSLTDKCYNRLVIYINMHFNLNIDI